MNPSTVPAAPSTQRQTAHSGWLRVPQPTALFWITKLMTTGLGEASSDFLVKTYDPVLVVLAAAIVFALCFVVQFSAGRYRPWRYWLFVTVVAVFGTMVADAIHMVLGVPYWMSTLGFATAVGLALYVWWRVEGTVSVHSVTTGRRELLYWVVVLATFALGTAFGDWTASSLGLGYLGSAFAFGVLFAMPFLGRRMGLPVTLSFWSAYVMTRPLGASVADWLGVEPSRGGLGIGTRLVSVAGLVLVSVCVWRMHREAAKFARGSRRRDDRCSALPVPGIGADRVPRR